jgi:hypothetical protein
MKFILLVIAVAAIVLSAQVILTHLPQIKAVWLQAVGKESEREPGLTPEPAISPTPAIEPIRR